MAKKHQLGGKGKMTIQEEIEIMIDCNNKLNSIWWKYQKDLPHKRDELSKQKDDEEKSYITNFSHICSNKIGLGDTACIQMEFDDLPLVKDLPVLGCLIAILLLPITLPFWLIEVGLGYNSDISIFGSFVVKKNKKRIIRFFATAGIKLDQTGYNKLRSMKSNDELKSFLKEYISDYYENIITAKLRKENIEFSKIELTVEPDLSSCSFIVVPSVVDENLYSESFKELKKEIIESEKKYKLLKKEVDSALKRLSFLPKYYNDNDFLEECLLRVKKNPTISWENLLNYYEEKHRVVEIRSFYLRSMSEFDDFVNKKRKKGWTFISKSEGVTFGNIGYEDGGGHLYPLGNSPGNRYVEVIMQWEGFDYDMPPYFWQKTSYKYD